MRKMQSLKILKADKLVIKNKRIKQKESNNTIINACPYCKSMKIIKFGKVRGVQRFRCKNSLCKKTFTEQHNSPFRYSKKFKYMWRQYYKLMEKGFTIRKCAAILKINIVTAFFWRHRILNSLTYVNKVELLKKHVELSKMVHCENFKGRRKKPFPKRSMIVIVSAIDNSRKITSMPVAKNCMGIKDLLKSIYPKIHKNALIVAYQDNRLKNLASKHNCNLGKEYEERVKRIRNIVNVEKPNKKIIEKLNKLEALEPGYSIKLMFWFKKFHGIATKYIEYYLNWYIDLYKIQSSFNNKFEDNNHSYLRWIDIKKKALIID